MLPTGNIGRDGWTVDITLWLDDLGLGQYAPAFLANDIDRETLATLGDDDLKELGVASLGHRKRLLRAIAALPPGGAAEAAPAPPAPAAALPEAERRQVTVLFADLAGYTALSRSLDAEALHRLTDGFLAAADRIIEAHGGTIDKHIGDCAMAVFGAPVAHGNDPERAVRAALAIQSAMPELGRQLGRPLEVHIGIAAGQVVASGTGGERHRAYTVTGDSVNLASRLTDAAGAGEILISDAVRAQLGERFELAAAGALPVKGFEHAVPAWWLLGIAGGRTAPPRPMVGRQAELRQVEGVLASCQESGCGQSVYIRGEAGIGKSRLAEAFQDRAAALGFACHVGLVLDFGTGTGRDAIRSLVRALLGLPLAVEDDTARDAVTAAIADGLLDGERRVFLNDLLDLPQPVDLRAVYDAMDHASRERGRRATLAELVRSASRRRPRLLLVEDLHWADRPTLDQLAILAETVADCPAVLVMTSRLEGDPLDRAWRARIGAAPLTTIDLGPLRPQEAEAFAGNYPEADADLVRRCLARAAGNPLFLEQLLRHAGERAGDVEQGVPASVQSLVQARMDRLGAADRRALQAAAVLGQRFAPEALRALVDDPEASCDGLIAALLVRPQGEDFLFAHALIRDAVYDTLLRARRRELHRRAADWFATRDRVLHAEHLERAEDPQAPLAFLAAARQQAGQYRYEAALRLVERGVALAREPAERFALTCFKGDVLHDLGRMPDARAAYQAALEVAPGGREVCLARLGLAAVARVVDELDAAFADLDAAEAAACAAGLVAERARIHFLRGNLCFPRGDIEGCLAEHEKSLELARAAGSAELEAAAEGGLGDAEYVRGRMITAHARFRRCVELCREHGFGRIEVANLGMIAHTELYFRPQAEALEDGLAAVEAAARVGHQRAELNACLAVIFASVALTRGDLARAYIARASKLVRRRGGQTRDRRGPARRRGRDPSRGPRGGAPDRAGLPRRHHLRRPRARDLGRRRTRRGTGRRRASPRAGCRGAQSSVVLHRRDRGHAHGRRLGGSGALCGSARGLRAPGAAALVDLLRRARARPRRPRARAARRADARGARPAAHGRRAPRTEARSPGDRGRARRLSPRPLSRVCGGAASRACAAGPGASPLTGRSRVRPNGCRRLRRERAACALDALARSSVERTEVAARGRSCHARAPFSVRQRPPDRLPRGGLGSARPSDPRHPHLEPALAQRRPAARRPAPGDRARHAELR